MLNLFSLLGEDTISREVSNIAGSAYTTFKTIVNIILPVLAGFVVVLGVILGVKIGVAFAQAEDEEAKKKAKGQLINVIIGFLVAIVFIAIITAVLNGGAIQRLFGGQLDVGGGAPAAPTGPS